MYAYKLVKLSSAPGHFFHSRNIKLLKIKAALQKLQRQPKLETEIIEVLHQ